MPYKEHNVEKKYYTIGEVANTFGVNTSLIRFWESEFPLINPQKNRKGNRQYTKEDIDNIRIVYHLVKEKGYTLQGAKDIIRTQRIRIEDNLKAIESLKQVRNFLVELKNQL